jgi:hypothetical protein
MPGLSNRNPVAGYNNMGKVHIRYKEKVSEGVRE